MIALWKRHIARRLARHAPQPMAAERTPDAPVSDDVGCSKCGKTREDAEFRHCRRC